jgi:hypothetical protein
MIHEHATGPIEDLELGRHVCYLYGDDDDHRKVLTRYLRAGLERGEKVVYIAGVHHPETILWYLESDGVDVEPYLRRRSLVITGPKSIFVREGSFCPDVSVASYSVKTMLALDEGYNGLRLSTDMSWSLHGHPGSQHLVSFEARLNKFFPGKQSLSLCQYDTREFPPAVLLYALATHPLVVLGEEVYDNPYYMVPPPFLDSEPPDVTLNQWLEAIKAGVGRFPGIFTQTEQRLPV